MIIAIGSDGNQLTDKISKRFGHANYYIIYDTESKEYKALINQDNDHTHSNLYDLIERGTQIFIVGNIGPHAFEIINTDNVKVYLGRKMTVEEAISQYSENKLEELKDPTVKKSISHGKDGQGKHHHHHHNH